MTHVGVQPEKLVCSFCGTSSTEATAMVTKHDGTCICEKCVATAAEAIMQETDTALQPDQEGGLAWARTDSFEGVRLRARVRRHDGVLTPQKLFHRLSEHVVGQDEAKIALSVAAYNHHVCTRVGRANGLGVRLEKSNVLVLGPTGCGKTLLARTLAEIVDVPLAISDATTLTEAGYIGEDVESVLRRLIQAAGGDVEKAQRGIVFIDEVDKIAADSTAGTARTRDASGAGVQRGLLKMLEGTDADVPMRPGAKNAAKETVRLDTRNILFILGGAFPGLADIVSKRIGAGGIGFGSSAPGGGDLTEGELLARVTPADLEKFGMLPELVGRVPITVSLDELTEEDLIRIQTKPVNAIAKQYQAQFALEGCDLVVTDGALRAIAREALGRKTGARGLRAIYERVLRRSMFLLPGTGEATEVTVRESDVVGETMPQICVRTTSAQGEECVAVAA